MAITQFNPTFAALPKLSGQPNLYSQSAQQMRPYFLGSNEALPTPAQEAITNPSQQPKKTQSLLR